MDDADHAFERFARDRADALLRYGYVLTRQQPTTPPT